MFKRFLIVSLICFAITTGCKKDSTTNTSGVPNVAVNISIDIYSANYAALEVVGGWEYVTGGYGGILIFCNASNSYLAFDRGCPYDCETNSKAIITVQSGNITAVCPVCGTTYSLYSGQITKGPGSVALKQYYTSFDGTYITVSNSP
jgi:nitrite reductase/ring-hydroxylating ferredoxin subunit